MRIASSIVGMFLFVPGLALSQDVPELLRTYGNVDAQSLVDVKAAAIRGDGLAVLSDPTPAVHVFTPAGYQAWGREGGGPAELSSPVDLAWSESSVMVLDVNRMKIVSYANDGSFLTTRTLGARANRMFLVEGDTILGTFTPMARGRAVVRYAGEARDTIFTYSTSANQVRLEAAGAPSLTVGEPFTPQPQWTVLQDGLLARWSPETSYIQLVNIEGENAGRIPGVNDSHPVQPEDREFWLSEAIPQDFMGRRVFEPIRQRAREVVTFPDEFPPVMELLGDPKGGVWVLKNTPAQGQVWQLIARDGQQLGSLRLPDGRKLLTVSPSEMVVWSADDLGVEFIEVYRRPNWGDS